MVAMRMKTLASQQAVYTRKYEAKKANLEVCLQRALLRQWPPLSSTLSRLNFIPGHELSAWSLLAFDTLHLQLQIHYPAQCKDLARLPGML